MTTAKTAPKKVSTPVLPDRIESWPIGNLKPYAANAKHHSTKQVRQIAASMREFGWTVPVLVSADGEVIAGHGRLLAAEKLGLDEVPVICVDHMSEAQRKAYRIADNRLTELGDWDVALLGSELRLLIDDEFDTSLTGFDDLAVADFLAGLSGEREDEDEVPEVPANPVTKVGDVWQLGRHRLVCGDATAKSDVEAALGGVVPHLMVTDPPYGVEYDASWRNRSLGASQRAVGKVSNDHETDWREAWALFPGVVAYVWHAGNMAAAVADSLVAAKLEIRAQIIWAKNNIVIGRGHYHPKHEPCWYAVRKGRTAHWRGGRKQPTVWDIDKPMKSETGHSTQKPVECMRRPIINNSKTGDHVYDPFLGSGTTIIAAETSDRICLGLEIDPAYCDVIVQRWENFTGDKAKLAK